jgi:hypothetical protein
MDISINYFAGITVALVWSLPRWVCCYELSYVYIQYLSFNWVTSCVYWDYCPDIIWNMENSCAVF